MKVNLLNNIVYNNNNLSDRNVAKSSFVEPSFKQNVSKNPSKYPNLDNFKAYFTCSIDKSKLSANEDAKYILVRDKLNNILEKLSDDKTVAEFNYNSNYNETNKQKLDDATNKERSITTNKDYYNQLAQIDETKLKDKNLSYQLKRSKQLFNIQDENNPDYIKLGELEQKIDKKIFDYRFKTEKNKNGSNDPLIMMNSVLGCRKKIKKDVVKLIKLRNKYARQNGYKNFFEYTLETKYNLTGNYVQGLLDYIPQHIKSENKEPQTKESVILYDKMYNKFDTVEQAVNVSKNMYKNMGFDIDSLPITMDLEPRSNKLREDSCFDTKDREYILLNMDKHSYPKLSVLSHELGHAVYGIGVKDQPYNIREPHTSTTEAVAMMMEDLTSKENVLKDYFNESDLKKHKESSKAAERHTIYHFLRTIDFEKQMYENPDQNLNKLWKDTSNKYGLTNYSKKGDDWLSITHFVKHPAYFPNYLRGSMIKAQIYEKMCSDLGPISENKNTAKYLNEKLFKYGSSIPEDELIKQFTGKELTPDALCKSISD